MDGMLSQEEINALLNGGGAENSNPSENDSDEDLTAEQIDTIGEVANISMGTAATTLYSLVNQKVTITTPVVSLSNWDDLVAAYDRPCVFLQIKYIEGIDGNNVLVLKESDVKVITDLMMGGDGTNTDGELGELHLSAISEAMNQMMGSSATSLSSMLNRKIDITPPIANLVDLNDTMDNAGLSEFLQGEFVKVSFKMEIGELVDSNIMQLYPIDFVKDVYDMIINSKEEAKEEEKKETNESAPQPQQAQPQQQQQMQGQPMQGQMQGQPMQGQPMQGQPMQGQPMQGYPMQGYPMQGYPMMNQIMGSNGMDINIQPAQFQAFNSGQPMMSQTENINLIMDVNLEVTVELGRTHKSIKEVLEFAPGTIIELNRIAGEPVDVLVNGKFVAKGEVVVIEESFGIRVTEIINY